MFRLYNSFKGDNGKMKQERPTFLPTKHRLDLIYIYLPKLLKYLKIYKSYAANKVSPLKFIPGR